MRLSKIYIKFYNIIFIIKKKMRNVFELRLQNKGKCYILVFHRMCERISFIIFHPTYEYLYTIRLLCKRSTTQLGPSRRIGNQICVLHFTREERARAR